jgi:hypothetical protein
MSNAANLALDGGDPREEFVEGSIGMTAARLHLVNDPKICFEEYIYYASITRAEEKAEYAATPKEKRSIKNIIKNRFRTNTTTISTPPTNASDSDEKSAANLGASTDSATVSVEGDEKLAANFDAPSESVQLRHYTDPSHVSDEEWKTLSRGIRTAGWSTCFYLITTDILGPFSTPYVPSGDCPADVEQC